MTTKKTEKTSDAIEKLEDKEGPAEGTAAYANELLAARAGETSKDEAKASLEANDPSKSHAAYTTEETKK